ncbi:DUF4190 domain-containing protein [Streptomyces sp. HNM0575]|nr:DUF4190 domain-containing protein [Streptomyces sp. HNM0575]
MNTLVRPGTSRPHGQDADNGTGPAAASGTEAPGVTGENRAPRAAFAARVRDADGMAVASFLMGLAGLLVFNLLLGPCALVLAGLSLARGTTRRGRAVLGLTLGAADLVVLAAVTAADQTFSWSITG